MITDRPAIVNFCSTAVDMLEFSTDSALRNAGMDMDYSVVTWAASREVLAFLHSRPQIRHVEYATHSGMGYVPNLRAMMNLGFLCASNRAEYIGIINTDMYLGSGWLKALWDWRSPVTIVNSLHISPVFGPNIVTADCGVPTYATFQAAKFDALYRKHYRNGVQTEAERGGWRATNTLPYLFHRHWWVRCGPWETHCNGHKDPPDRRFFQRCHAAGAHNLLVLDSVVYHHEGHERRNHGPPPSVGPLPDGRTER